MLTVVVALGTLGYLSPKQPISPVSDDPTLGFPGPPAFGW
jgi:hypothetical protein